VSKLNVLLVNLRSLILVVEKICKGEIVGHLKLIAVGKYAMSNE